MKHRESKEAIQAIEKQMVELVISNRFDWEETQRQLDHLRAEKLRVEREVGIR